MAYLVASVVKVLQRSLFRAPVHEHYGTGIASGLADRPGYAVGGRVNLQQGGDLLEQAQEAMKTESMSEARESIFDGKNKLTGTLGPGAFDQLSLVAQDYNTQLYNLLQAEGLDKEAFNKLSRERQEIIAQILNDRIFENLSQRYNVSMQELDTYFGGELVITNALGSIKRQLKYKPEVIGDKVASLQNDIETRVASIEQDFPTIFETDETDDETDETDDGTDVPDAGTGGDMVTEQGLMGLDRTKEDFRKRYVEYLQNLQQETGIADKRRRQAREAGFFNLGAAAPVQPGESLVRAGIQAFKDPMAELRAQEAIQAEDIYKRGADVLDQALSPSDSANVLLIQELVNSGIPRSQAIDMVTGLSQQRAAAFLESLQDGMVQTRIAEIMEENPGISRQRAAEQAIGFALPQSAEEILNQQQQQANIGAQTITQQGLTAPTLGMGGGGKDGGRVGLQQGGQALSEAVTQEQMAPTAIDAGSPTIEAMSFDELREKLPNYISDEVVKLLSENPMALMELAQAQTDRDLKEFEKKYKVDVTMPQAESEVDYTGAV